MRFFSILAALVLLAAPLSQGAQEHISVESSVDRQTITIGDRILYTVTVTADTALTVDSLVVGSNLGMFEVKDYIPRKSRISGSYRISTEAFEITTFTTGDYQIPSITIRYWTPEGEMKLVTTDPLMIQVNSLLTGEEGEDIRPLRGPRSFDSPLPVWIIAAAVALLIALAVFIILYRRARRPVTLGLKEVDPRLPWEIALDALARLERDELPAKGEFKQFYLRLSDIFRHYLERRYGIAALERTTFEIIEEFRALSLDKEEERMIQQLLEDCDLVKFAKHLPTVAETSDHLKAAREFVLRTRTLPYTSRREGQDRVGAGSVEGVG